MNSNTEFALELAASREQGISGTLLLSKTDPTRRVFQFRFVDEALKVVEGEVDYDELFAAAPARGIAVIQTRVADETFYDRLAVACNSPYREDDTFGGYFVFTSKTTFNYQTGPGPVNLTPQIPVSFNKLSLHPA